MSRLFKAKHYVYLCPDPLLLIFVQELEKNDSWNHEMISCLLLGKHWNTVLTFFTFLRVFVPLGTFYFLFFTQYWVSITHTMKSTFPPQRWFLSTAFAVLLRSLQWNKCGAFWRGGCYAVMYLQRCITRPKADLSIAVLSFNKASADGVRHTVCVFVSCFLCACKPVMSAQGEAAENGCFFPHFLMSSRNSRSLAFTG